MKTIKGLIIEDIVRCSCGAITVFLENGNNYSMSKETAAELIGEFETTLNDYGNCNYCVNHWGIDLCGCGSGEKVGKCTEDFEECKNHISVQILGEIKDLTPKFKIMKFEKSINNLVEQAQKIRQEINNKIINLPDNKKIKRLNKNCFTMNVSDLENGNNLSPIHYDFKYQYTKLLEHLNSINIDKLIIRLREILKKGYFITGNSKYLITLHFEVIKYLKTILI